MISALVKSMRPHQWVKNGFVLAPLVFSQNLTSQEHVLEALAAALMFCLGSGAVYIINDLVDREGDRAHPVKRNRPIASGALPVSAARVAAIVLLVGSVTAASLLAPLFGAILATYATMNLAYSLQLKHVAFVDAGIIATGFLLRVLGGALAIDVPISIWLVVCTFLLSLYLALGKRKHELLTLGTEAKTRKVLDNYDLEHVKVIMGAAAGATATSYAAYTWDTATRTQFQTDLLPLTIPFIAYGLVRFYLLTHREDYGSPTELMIKDVPFIANIVLWGVITVALIYL